MQNTTKRQMELSFATVETSGSSLVSRFRRPESLQRISGLATDAVRSVQSLPTLSLAALLATAMLATASYAQDAGSESSSESESEGGDCGSCDEEPNDTGETDVCREDDCSNCDSGDSEQGPDEGPGGIGTPVPVVWETGEKWESEIDLVVPLKGKDFRLFRKYSSDNQLFDDTYNSRARVATVPGWWSMDLDDIKHTLGGGWGIGNLRAATARERVRCLQMGQCNPQDTDFDNIPDTWDTLFQYQHDGTDVQILRAGRKPRAYTVPAASWYSSVETEGPGNQTIQFESAGYSYAPGSTCECGQSGGVLPGIGKVTGTLRFQEPGQWVQEYALMNGFGYISRDEDAYGNTRIYEDFSGDGDDIPDRIWLNGSNSTWNDADMAEAWVNLIWDDTDPDDSSMTNNQLRILKRAEVYRPTSSGAVMTQAVDYHHLMEYESDLDVMYWDPDPNNDGDQSDAGLYSSNTSPSDDLGTAGDLVQVVTYKAIDPLATTVKWQIQVKQYRYHNGSVYSLTDQDSGYDIRLDITGEDHELKMVFNPQQIEYLAQSSSSPGTPTDTTILDLATLMMSLDDVTEVYTGVSMYDAAGKIISYDTSVPAGQLHPVSRQFLQAEGCGCGSSGAVSAVMRDYEQYDWTYEFGQSPFTEDVNGKTMRINEYEVTNFAVDPSLTASDLYRSYFYDLLLLGDAEDKPYLWMSAVVPGDATYTSGTTSDAWVTRKNYDRDSRAVVSTAFPSSHTDYTPATSSTAPDFTPAGIGNGLINKYSYDGTENVGDFEVGGIGSTVPQYTTEYITDEPYLEHLPKTKIFYRDSSSTTDNQKEVIDYSYGFDGASSKIQWRKITSERELSSENGPSGSNPVVEWEFYSDHGMLIWEMDADSSLTRYEYDELSGRLAKIVRNADPTNYSSEIDSLNMLVSGAGPLPTTSPSDGELVTTYERDLLGRITKITRPGGVERWIVRDMVEDPDQEGILYFGKTMLPHLVSSSGTKTFDGPVTKQIYDADWKTIRMSSYELSPSASYDPDNGTFTVSSTELSRSVNEYSLEGAKLKSIGYLHIGETFEVQHETEYDYDAFGRMTQVTDAEGTISANVHDVLDRVISAAVGTTSSTPIIVAEYFYDGNSAAATPDQGVGNGNVTAVALYDGETSDARITRMYYDGRDRLIAIVPPDSAMSVSKYDNLDRVIEEAAYGDPVLTSNPIPSTAAIAYLSSSVPNDDTTHGYGERAWHTVTDYSQRGLVWRQRVAIDPASSSTSNYLDWLMWYDAEGNEIASWGPNSPMTVYEYDEHDRVSKLYVSDRFYEIDQSDFSFTNATSVSGDTVLEQAEYTYDDDAGGVLELIKTKMRVHDATATGALADNDSITSYLGLIYDNALRQVATVNFGTNKSTFSDGTSTAPTLSSYATLADLRSATDVLFSWQEYNTRGMVDEVVSIQSGTTAADEIRTKYLYDDLYRTFAVIENYDNATLAWNTTEGRYVASGLDHTDLSEDRITSFVHDKVNKVTKRVAHIAADSGGSTVEDAQVTAYFYGVSNPVSPGVMDSLVSSNNLLREVWYPNESTGEAYTIDSGSGLPVTDDKYKVKYAFNRLGELRGVIDQNQTTRIFDRDEQGRVLADIVHNITTHTGTNARNIDDDIERIGYEYDGLGRMTSATSHTTTASSGNIRDQVEIAYTPLWQVEKIYQQHDAVVDPGTSPAVEYLYSNMPASGAEDNYSRLIKVNYPTDVESSRDTVQYFYGTDDINDRISRVSKLQVLGLNGTTGGGGAAAYADLISYDRIGLGMTAKATVGLGSAWDAVLDRTVNHDGSSSSGAYPAFDRFGRIVSHMWVRDDFGPHGSAGSLSNQPAYLEVTHTYDRSSNRLSYSDSRQGAKLPDRNRTFHYDRLNRLTQEIRTPIPSGSTYTSQHASLRWNLDTMGNWNSVDTDSDHDGDFLDGSDLDHELVREHNMANEIESGLQYDARIYESATHSSYKNRLYDDNGNMTDERAGASLPAPGYQFAGQKHTYDAWNRLVKTDYIAGNGASTTIGTNAYNALGWRTIRTFDEEVGAFDGVDQKRLYYYGADWRMLEERIDTDVSTNSDSEDSTDDDTDWIGQQFWGIRYIDDAVGKRVDRDGDGDFVDADCSYWYQLTDTQFSVGVVLNEMGFVYERIEYDAYGQAKHRFGGDTNGNGQYDFFDISTFFGSGSYTISDTTNYHADLDRNADGYINTLDLGTSTSSLPSGWISDPNSSDGPDNSIGYAGYVFNHEREDYSVRHRNYNPELGRWMQRDPIGYRGGPNLFEYVMGHPINYVDPSGLERSECNEQLICRVAEAIARDCPGLAARQALAELAAAGLTPAEIGLALKGGAAAGGIGAALTSPRSGHVRSGDGRAMAYRSAGRGSSALRGVGRGFGAAGLGLGGYATYSEYAQGDSDGGAIAATSTAASGLFVTGGVSGMGTAGGLTGVVSTSGAATGTLAVAGAVGAGVGVVGLGVAIYLASELDATWDEIEEMANNPETNGRCNFLANEYNKARARCRNE